MLPARDAPPVGQRPLRYSNPLKMQGANPGYGAGHSLVIWHRANPAGGGGLPEAPDDRARRTG